jgi:hypothetical protein
MDIAFSRIGSGFQRLESPPPPIHWPSAVVGLTLAVAIVVGVTWVASVQRPEARAVSIARTASQETAPPSDDSASLQQVVPTPIPPPAPDLPAATERLKVANTRGLGVNLRASAGERAPKLKTLPEGALLEAIGDPQSADGLTWRNVRDATGTVGWVAANFIAGP